MACARRAQHGARQLLAPHHHREIDLLADALAEVRTFFAGVA
jgi:hypothetical protein